MVKASTCVPYTLGGRSDAQGALSTHQVPNLHYLLLLTSSQWRKWPSVLLAANPAGYTVVTHRAFPHQAPQPWMVSTFEYMHFPYHCNNWWSCVAQKRWSRLFIHWSKKKKKKKKPNNHKQQICGVNVQHMNAVLQWCHGSLWHTTTALRHLLARWP